MILYIVVHAIKSILKHPRAGEQNMVTSNLSIFDAMEMQKRSALFVENVEIRSHFLKRMVKLDFFLPTSVNDLSEMSLLLINDGQDMKELGLASMLEALITAGKISPLLAVGIYAGDRKMEYGTAKRIDYKGRGAGAKLYTRFIFEELLPFIMAKYLIPSFREKAFAGFSMGGLSALDIVWHHPGEFSRVGVFSGSLWWRKKALDNGYNEDKDRIMHAQVRAGKFKPGLKFFFQTGTLDETMDRNGNGIIDSIDDTKSLIHELEKKGYHPDKDIRYLELKDGKHDIATWAQAMPEFLMWGWGRES